ncbi:iron complex transport system permease protein [Paraburkholderia eburnea]|uniref:Iron complex transport system permease protein n=2 Tax=Paraburkholderia eburnea TaxID=1189126 RepID=A0A2S4LV46_9BURK|nr:iron complex transport system permease protein [Paraburkholderia eburnea]PRZ16269.1 iron complex transport system permease protein [Paraburkholderia eburnea]
MDESIEMQRMPKVFSMSPFWLTGALAMIALALSLHRLDLLLPMRLWRHALLAPDSGDMRQLVFYASDLPRLVVCLLAGAQLSLAGAIFQQVLRNPLAEPTTLGVSAGASLALSLTMLYAPSLLFGGQEWVALGGASLGMLIVVALAWNSRLSPVALILAGLILNFYCGSIDAVLTLFHHDDLQSIFIWGAGSLNQNNWDAPRALLPRLLAGLLLAALLARSLAMMSLADDSAKALGVSLRLVRVGALALAVGLAASVVASVGVIGFLGVLAPTIVRLAGARRFRDRLVWAPLFGAVLLWLTDEIVQGFTGAWAEVPTGAAMSMLGAPFLFWLLPRLHALPDTVELSAVHRRAARPRVVIWLALGVGALIGAVALGLGTGVSAAGWAGWPGAHAGALLHWRWPHVCAALVAGTLLSLAGVVLQRSTGNAMASPEVLGISAGASLGLIALVFVARNAGHLLQSAAAGAGAFATLLVMLMLGRRHGFAPARMLLTGVTLGTAFSALVTVLLAGGDPRMSSLLGWMAGSTYDVTGREAATACLLLIGLGIVAATLIRWLEILPLGEAVATSLGMNTRIVRLALLLLAAVMTGIATLLVGPFSFIGLMAPHLARMLGFGRAAAQLAVAAVLGALIMVGADWIGRNAMFPFQIPVGLVATLLGGLYFMGLMLRGDAAQ